MSYAKSVLQPGETIVAMGRLHWIGYWPAALALVLGVVLVSLLYAYQVRAFWIWTAVVVFGAPFIFFFVRAWFDRWLTEIAVTDRRVIYKRGLIYRHTAEMNMDKVESVVVVQSILGRLLDYGNVEIKGTGQGMERLREIASPIALRHTIIAK